MIVYDDAAQNEMINAVSKFTETFDVKGIMEYEIGNNCNYLVYYRPETANELQQCGSINVNSGMYGEGLVSCEDYN